MPKFLLHRWQYINSFRFQPANDVFPFLSQLQIRPKPKKRLVFAKNMQACFKFSAKLIYFAEIVNKLKKSTLDADFEDKADWKT